MTDAEMETALRYHYFKKDSPLSWATEETRKIFIENLITLFRTAGDHYVKLRNTYMHYVREWYHEYIEEFLSLLTIKHIDLGYSYKPKGKPRDIPTQLPYLHPRFKPFEDPAKAAQKWYADYCQEEEQHEKWFLKLAKENNLTLEEVREGYREYQDSLPEYQ